MKVILPLRAEFGLKLWWHVPAVHAIPSEGGKAVYIEQGEEALYPSATEWVSVIRQEDGKRRNRYARDQTFVDLMAEDAKDRFPGAEILKPHTSWERRRFVPEPYAPVGSMDCDVVVSPRKRVYGGAKNWEHWPVLTAWLVEELGASVWAGGAPDSSYEVPCPKAWDYPRFLDLTIKLVRQAKLVVATDAGLAHLAVLCGTPLLMITHGEGLVAPGPSSDENGRVMDEEYWPVKLERFHEANHTGSPIHVLHHAWFDPQLVYEETLRRVRE